MGHRVARRLYLAKNWEFRALCDAESAWRPSLGAPTVVHQDLQHLGMIPDFTLDMNEKAVQWVGHKTWVYRSTFSLAGGALCTDLVFEGLDTFTTIRVNGHLVMETDNMFVKYRVSLRHVIDPDLGGDQSVTLEITFHPAFQRGRELVEKHRHEHEFLVRQTDAGRLPVRKAQYHWGWDWGPVIMTCGPWQPVYLEQYETRIEDVWVESRVSENLAHCRGTVFVEVRGRIGDGLKCECDWTCPREESNPALDPSREGLRSSAAVAGEHGGSTKIFRFPFEFPGAGSPLKLWYPRGYGAQPRYRVNVRLLSDQTILAQTHRDVGLRRVELVQAPDAHGTSFYFRINNIDVFAGGSCWIPPHNLLPMIHSRDYRRWVDDLVEGNQVMVRVWGGGVYADDRLLEACDDMGILVWQDFQFACGSYPTYQAFLDNVETEARQQVRRLRTHPSVVIWAGNNEDYEVQQRYGLDYDYQDKNPESWLKSSWPARYIYEHLLPRLVQEEHPAAVYHPSSPWGDGKHTTDPTVGDTHQWNIWHGALRKYQEADQLGSRFVSEFGMEAYPHLRTIEGMITDPGQRRPGSMPMDFHNKAIDHERRLIAYVAENYHVSYDLALFAHLSQMVQADCMRCAYKSWRRDWGKPGERGCGGALVWQLNDCWPTMSWAVIDFHGIRKPAFYAIQRALRPLDVGVRRRFRDWTHTDDWVDARSSLKTGQVDHTKFARNIVFDVWAVSSRTEPAQVTLNVRFISIASGRDLATPLHVDANVIANGTSAIFTSKAGPAAGTNPDDSGVPFAMARYDPYVINVSLLVDGVVVAEDDDWPDPIKYLDMSNRSIDWDKSDGGRGEDASLKFVVRTGKPVKGIVFQESENLHFNDNGFDLMPGKGRLVKITHREGAKLPDWKSVVRDLRYTYVGASGLLKVPEWLVDGRQI